MVKLNEAITQGAHQPDLTVNRLAKSAAFFTETAGWHEVRRIPEYPAVFVSDGPVMRMVCYESGAI